MILLCSLKFTTTGGLIWMSNCQAVSLIRLYSAFWEIKSVFDVFLKIFLLVSATFAVCLIIWWNGRKSWKCSQETYNGTKLYYEIEMGWVILEGMYKKVSSEILTKSWTWFSRTKCILVWLWWQRSISTVNNPRCGQYLHGWQPVTCTVAMVTSHLYGYHGN